MSIELPPGYAFDPNGQLCQVKLSGRMIPKSIHSLQQTLGPAWPEFVKSYLAEYPLKIRIATGDDIHDVFENHRPGSCMRYSNCHDMCEVYANNPKDVCVAYILKDDNPILCSDASCLVWTGASRIYVDRVYCSGWPIPDCLDLFITGIGELFADKELCSIYHDTTNHRKYRKRVTFTLRHDEDEPLPYMDSINIITEYSSRSVTLSTDGCGECCQDTNGTIPNGNGRYSCCDCGCRVHEDDMRMTDYGDIYCDDCYSERYVYVSVRIHGRWFEGDYPIDDVVEIDGEWYPKDECYQLHNGDYALADDCVEMHDGEYALADDCVEMHDGDYALADDCVKLHNGEFALSVDCEELHNGEYALADDCVKLHNGQFALSVDCEELHNGEFALSDDCTQLHNGEFALSGDSVELSPMIYNPDAYALRSDCIEMEDGWILVTDKAFQLV